MRQSSTELRDTSPRNLGEVICNTVGNLQLGLQNEAGRQAIQTTSQEVTQEPIQLANRAMNAASWLLSNPQKIMRMNSNYGMVFNEKTQADEWVPIAPVLSFSNELISGQIKDRLPSLLRLASQTEVIFHLNRLMLHRRKASLGEATIPMFISDLAGDLRRMQITSLGAALLVDHLRTSPRNEWFPSWPEIESAATAIERGISKLRNDLENNPKVTSENKKTEQIQKQDEPEMPEYTMSQECLAAWLSISKERSLTDEELESWKRGEMPDVTETLTNINH